MWSPFIWYVIWGTIAEGRIQQTTLKAPVPRQCRYLDGLAVGATRKPAPRMLLDSPDEAILLNLLPKRHSFRDSQALKRGRCKHDRWHQHFGISELGATEVKIADLSRINVFIGKNNCGKSNVLRFVKYLGALLNARGIRQPPPTLDRWIASIIAWAALPIGSPSVSRSGLAPNPNPAHTPRLSRRFPART